MIGSENLKKRIISAIVMILIVLPLIVFGGLCLKIGTVVLGACSMYELLKQKNNMPLFIKIISIISVMLVIYFSNSFSIFSNLYFFPILFLLFFISVVFIEAVEKDIPLQQIKKLFGSETDQLLIYQKIVDYEPETFNETADEVPESDNDVNSLLEIPNQGDGAEKIDDKECDKQEDSGYAEMFNSLITVMSIKKDGDNSARTVSDNLNKIVAKFQLAASELAAYSSEVVHEVENDKEEIKRLNALLNLQQRVMSSQQNKINEMRGEIVRLNTRIQNAERTEMRREAINQKISELQSLTLNERKDSENAYSYLEG